jgi:hypothetical protein
VTRAPLLNQLDHQRRVRAVPRQEPCELGAAAPKHALRQRAMVATDEAHGGEEGLDVLERALARIDNLEHVAKVVQVRHRHHPENLLLRESLIVAGGERFARCQQIDHALRARLRLVRSSSGQAGDASRAQARAIMQLRRRTQRLGKVVVQI